MYNQVHVSRKNASLMSPFVFLIFDKFCIAVVQFMVVKQTLIEIRVYLPAWLGGCLDGLYDNWKFLDSANPCFNALVD